MKPAILVGTAGWSLPKADARRFPPDGTHLQRYAARLNCVEINSSFYRPHKPATYARWASDVPQAFRFSVKLPRTITHDARLQRCGKLLDEFLGQAGALGNKLGCLLVQLPPSLGYERGVAARFLRALRHRYEGVVVFEPRHVSWFAADADALLQGFRVARVAADPALAEAAGMPGGDTGCVYFRLHGSPRMYYSTYPEKHLRSIVQRLRAAHAAGSSCWCIFDNTALGAATPNALRVLSLIGSQ